MWQAWSRIWQSGHRQADPQADLQGPQLPRRMAAARWAAGYAAVVGDTVAGSSDAVSDFGGTGGVGR